MQATKKTDRFVSHVTRYHQQSALGVIDYRDVEIITTHLRKGDLSRGLSYVLDWTTAPQTGHVEYTLHSEATECPKCRR